VTEMDLDGTDVERARSRVCAELVRVENPEALGKSLDGPVRLLLGMRGLAIPDGALEQTIPLIIRGLMQWPMGRAVALRAGQAWYGHRDKGWNRDPVAELVALNRMAKQKNEDAQAEVVQVLMAAFLADVRSEAARARAMDPVLLLDNVDSGPAVDFLRALNAARTAPGADLSPDHLTVIATSNGSLLTHLGVTDDERLLDDVGIEELRAGRVDAPGPWLPMVLRDLTDAEIGSMASDTQLEAESRHCMVRAVLGLTHGHPGGSQLLLQDAAAAGPDRMNLQALLRARSPDRPDGTTGGERILNSMLRPLPEPLRGDLITCAAARTQEEAELLARSGLLTAAVPDRVAVLSRAYWGSYDLDGRPVMHPLLRRLLLRELAARDRESPHGWVTVFGWLVANVSRADHDSDWLHHALALGDVVSVAEMLTDLLAIHGGEVWLRLVRSLVTTAVPTFLTDSPVHTVGQVVADALPHAAQAVDRGDRIATVARLLTAWQAVGDPLVTVERADLHAMVATGLDAVAVLACNGFAVLVGEADRHRKLARLWQGCGASQRVPAHRDLNERGRDAP